MLYIGKSETAKLRSMVMVSSLFVMSGCAADHHYPMPSKDQALLGTAVGLGMPVISKAEAKAPFMHFRSGPDFIERLSGAGHQAFEGFVTGARYGAAPAMSTGRCGGKGCLITVGLALAGAAVGATVGGVTGTVSGALAGDFSLPDDVAEAVKQSGIREHFLR